MIVTEPSEHADFESSPDAYKVKLDSFEGPLDLLLGQAVAALCGWRA